MLYIVSCAQATAETDFCVAFLYLKGCVLVCGRDAGVEVVLLAMRLMSRIRRYVDGLDALFLQLLQVSAAHITLTAR